VESFKVARRFLKLLIAPVVATSIALTAADTRALESAAEWLEALRPVPLRDPFPKERASRQGSIPKGDEDTRHSLFPVAVLAFAPGSTRLTDGSSEILDQLASALTSPELAPNSFQIAWYAGTAAEPALAARRAAAVCAYLEAKPGITPRRLDMRRLEEVPPGISEPLAGDALAIRVLNLGLTED
jgi:outer membrane protein OmpA-like peptidoglycan-associated protein